MRFLVIAALAFVSLSSKSFAASSGAELCFKSGTVGEKNFATPWPITAHAERHASLQADVGAHYKALQACGQLGELKSDIKFNVAANGHIQVLQAEATQAGLCYKQTLERIQASTYSCDLNVTYTWDGQFPLVSREARLREPVR